jgi:DMSO/TMAO reductase YedYZ heme-binding membrane subunit
MKPALFLLCLLPLASLVWRAFGIAGTDLGANPVEKIQDTLGQWGLRMLLITLAVTSTNGMMRRLGRRWKTLHRLIYLIVLLGIWHYYWQVKADVREPLLYLAIALVLLCWRVWKVRRRFLPSHRGTDRPELREET